MNEVLNGFFLLNTLRSKISSFEFLFTKVLAVLFVVESLYQTAIT